jgi:hypothetical protein
MQPRRTDLPHVTDILKAAGLIDSTWFNPLARDRGTALHLATALVDDRDLDRSSLDPSIVGCVEAYEKFLSEMAPTILATEEAVEHLAFRYCGTLDRRVILTTAPDFHRAGVLDLKRGGPAPWHPVQLSAYANCLTGPQVKWNLYLSETGRYRLVEHPATDGAWWVFKAALTLHNWRKKCQSKS